jgi:uncharacterized protein YaaR (DUF327 family)
MKLPTNDFKTLKESAEMLVKTEYFLGSHKGFLMRVCDSKDAGIINDNEVSQLLEIISGWNKRLKDDIKRDRLDEYKEVLKRFLKFWVFD